jgi:hypothetical protein
MQVAEYLRTVEERTYEAQKQHFVAGPSLFTTAVDHCRGKSRN